MGLRINSNACVLVALLIGVFVQTSSALRCWHCTSHTEKDFCSDPFNNTEYDKRIHAENCEPQNVYGSNNRYVCKKIVQKDNGKLEVLRHCALNDEELDNGPCGPQVVTQSGIVVQSCHICNTDYCNGASSISGMQLIQACVVAVITCAISPSIRSFF